MEKNPTFLSVVAALVRNEESQILLQQALPGKRHAGFWEFPGGKVDAGETARAALLREIREELGIMLDEDALSPAAFADQPAADGHPALVLLLYTCSRWSGSPAALEGQAWGWFAPAEIDKLPLAPLDRALFANCRPSLLPSS